MKKPIIGISSSINIENGGPWPGYRRCYANEDYINAVIKNGGIPYIIPCNTNEDVIKDQVSLIDGLLLTGGHDVSPRNYKQEPHPKLGEILPERDVFDLTLLKHAEERQIPVFGVCRGLQIMNVYYGGTLYQDVSQNNEFTIKHDQEHTPTMVSHTVTIRKDSKLYDVLALESLMVNSFHHQMIEHLAEGFLVTAESNDRVIEAIERENYPYMLAVQWHPEMLHAVDESMSALFGQFIAHTKKK